MAANVQVESVDTHVLPNLSAIHMVAGRTNGDKRVKET